MRALLDAGAGVAEPMRRGHWAMLSACQHGQVEAVRLLARWTPESTQASTVYGATPLMQAAKFGQTDVLPVLLAAGAIANACIQDDDRQSAMDYAVRSNSCACVWELLVYGTPLPYRRCVTAAHATHASEVAAWLSQGDIQWSSASHWVTPLHSLPFSQPCPVHTCLTAPHQTHIWQRLAIPHPSRLPDGSWW